MRSEPVSHQGQALKSSYLFDAAFMVPEDFSFSIDLIYFRPFYKY